MADGFREIVENPRLLETCKKQAGLGIWLSSTVLPSMCEALSWIPSTEK
jgi:hypothetical protein